MSDICNPKVVVILHLFYTHMWTNFKIKLKILKDIIDFDLYVSICNQDGVIEKDIIDFGGKIFHIENKGLDIGPFLYTLKYIFDNDIKYKYLLKLHTKKNNPWRNRLMECLLGSEEKIKENLKRIKKFNMVSDENSFCVNEYMNSKLIEEYMKFFNLKRNEETCFSAGTMFWAKMEIFEKYFNSCSLNEIYNSLEKGAFNDFRNGTRTHALERIFGYMACQNGHSIQNKMKKIKLI